MSSYNKHRREKRTYLGTNFTAFSLARQAQVKADEIAKLMKENEQLKIVNEDLKRKSNAAETESL